jgi:hypothetical protein
MSTIQAKAQMVASNMHGDPNAPNPVDIITTIIAIITDVMKVFSACGNSPAQAQARIVKPGFIEKVTLKSAIRRHTNLHALRTPLFHSTLKVAATLTEPEVKMMMTEAM